MTSGVKEDTTMTAQSLTCCDLSVVIVNWNTCSLLHNCLMSLVNTDQPLTIEIIVVDNASTDGSVKMIQHDFPDIWLVMNTSNVGFAPACNQGLAIARGRYSLLLNSDTGVAPDALKQLVNFMDTHPQAGACGPQLRNADGTLQPSGRAFPTLGQALMALLPVPVTLRRVLANPIEHRDYSQVAAVDEVSGAALCLRMAALQQVGNLDERFFFFGEDVDLCWRLHTAGWLVYYVPHATITHFWGGSRAKLNEQMGLLAQRAYVRLLCKHRPGLSATIITIVAFVLTIVKGTRRSLSALLHGNRAAAVASWRMHRAELVKLRSP